MSQSTSRDGDLVNDCVRYIINKGCSRYPIKKPDICKYLNSINSELSHSRINSILLEAKSLLKDVYGYKLVQLSSNIIQYILIHDDINLDKIHEVSNIDKHHSLLVAVLSHILMSGGAVKEDDMWNFLDKTGFVKNNDYAKRKILTHQLTKEVYLSYTKVGEGDTTKYMFEWGERATAEIPKTYLLKKIEEALDHPPGYWCEQSKSAQEIDKQNFPQLFQAQS